MRVRRHSSEAGACATPVISDVWDGLSDLLEPGREILFAHSTDDVIAALEGIEPDRARAIGEAARHRVLAEHTAAHRAAELERHIEETRALNTAAGQEQTA